MDILPPFIESLGVTCDEDKTGLGDVDELIATVAEFPALRDILVQRHDLEYDDDWKCKRKLLWKANDAWR